MVSGRGKTLLSPLACCRPIRLAQEAALHLSCHHHRLPRSARLVLCARLGLPVRHTLGWWPIPWLAALSWQYYSGTYRIPHQALGLRIAHVRRGNRAVPNRFSFRNLPVADLVRRTLRYTFLNLIFWELSPGRYTWETGAFARWVNIAWLKFFGEISYGLYLVHRVTFDVVDHAGRKLFPATFATTWHMGQVAIRFVIGGALAVLLAFLSRWYFEERFLRLKNRAFAASIPGFVGKKALPSTSRISLNLTPPHPRNSPRTPGFPTRSACDRSLSPEHKSSPPRLRTRARRVAPARNVHSTCRSSVQYR